jgi:hypothetical protein
MCYHPPWPLYIFLCYILVLEGTDILPEGSQGGIDLTSNVSKLGQLRCKEPSSGWPSSSKGHKKSYKTAVFVNVNSRR